jgi:G:T-mismatch repair DNA endonuclease (very short patch repair protein)
VNKLKKGGWDVMVVWECELGDLSLLKNRLIAFLTPSKSLSVGQEEG